jgi:uncharacterized protein
MNLRMFKALAACGLVGLVALGACLGLLAHKLHDVDRQITLTMGAYGPVGPVVMGYRDPKLYGTRLLAQMGDTSAQVVLGTRLQYGCALPVDMDAALAWYRRAAALGNSTGELLLGRLYDGDSVNIMNGTGTPESERVCQKPTSTGEPYPQEDETLALEWYGKAARQGNGAAELLLGEKSIRQERSGDEYVRVAARWFGEAARHGSVAALTKLGWMYTAGYGVEKNEDEGRALLQQGAEQGDTEAALDLGMDYEDQRALRPDPTMAVRWYRYAADRGNVFAERNLARMYADGMGVPRDYVSAYMWANVAASGGAPGAREILDRVESRMSPGQLSDAQARSSAWMVLR